MFKKILFVLLGITLFTTIDVYAESLNLYFFGNGGKPNTTDFYISDEYDFINYNHQDFYASYNTGKTISKLNSISGKTFTVEKSGDSLVKGREWYFVDGGKVYYFSQSKKYSVDTILTDLGNDTTDFLSLNLYANWSSKPKKGGKDMRGSGGSSSKETTTKKETTKKEKTKKKDTHVIIKYNMNGGSLDKIHGAIISASGKKILKNKSEEVQKVVYGNKVNVSNYNNNTFINIVRKDYRAKKGAEWNTKADGSGKSYNQSENYETSKFCDASSKDCTVTLYVNWEKTPVTSISVDKKNVTLEAGKSETVTANSNVASGYVWSVDKPSVAVVENGKITAISKGNAKVTVKPTENKGISATVEIKVNPKQNKEEDNSKDGYFYFFDYGTGEDANADAILVKSNNHYGLIDTGESGHNLVSKLNALGVEKLDFLLITHHHNDHIGGFNEVMNGITVDKLYIKKDGTKDPYFGDRYKKLIAKAEEKGATVCDVKNQACQTFTLGYISFKLYNTTYYNYNEKECKKANKDPKHYKFENINSTVAVATVNGKKVYLAGDIGNYCNNNAETNTAKKIGQVYVYKAAHHGATTYNNNKSALKYLKYTYAIITNKRTNDNKEGRERIKAASPNYKRNFMTSEGTVEMRIDSNGKAHIVNQK